MNSFFPLRQIHKNGQNLAVLTAVFAGLLFFTLLTASVVVVKAIGNSKSFAAGAATCSYAGPNPAVNGNQFTITYNGFAQGENILLLSRLFGSTAQSFGTTQDSLSSAKTQSFTFTAGPGGYSVLIQTRFPIQNFVCGNVDINSSPVDTDKDGFSDIVENYVGTDPSKSCGVNAWPPDFDNNGKVGLADNTQLSLHWNTIAGDGKYDKRFDLNMDGRVGLADLNILTVNWNKLCVLPTPTPNPILYNLSATPSTHSITLNWTPALQYNPGTLGLYYGDMTAANTTTCSGTNPALTGSFAGALSYDLKVGQSSFTWNTSTTNYPVTPGHKYCVNLVQWAPGGTGVVISNFLEVTAPAS